MRPSTPLRRVAASCASAFSVVSSAAKPFKRRFRVAGPLALAFHVFRKLNEAQVKLRHAVLGALFFPLQRFARDHQPVQRGGGLGLRVAQARQRSLRQRLQLGSLRLLTRALGDDAHADVLGMLGIGNFRLRRDPAQVKQRRLGLADLCGDRAVAHGLARLAFESVHLRRQLGNNVFQPGEILLRRLQAQFGFVPTLMQAGNAGRLLQHAASLFRLGLDDLADAALMHQRGRAGAGRSVGEQQLHVARAHFTAVDAIGRTGVTLDAARDFQACRHH